MKTGLEDMFLEWEGEHPLFDNFDFVETSPQNAFAMRTMIAMRGAPLKDIILAWCGYMTIYDSDTINQSTMGNLVLAFCAVILVNPFKVKVLRGAGIDELIEASSFDEDTNERFIYSNEFIKFCTNNNISQNLPNWLKENNFTYEREGKIYFKRTLKSGKVISKA